MMVGHECLRFRGVGKFLPLDIMHVPCGHFEKKEWRRNGRQRVCKTGMSQVSQGGNKWGSPNSLPGGGGHSAMSPVGKRAPADLFGPLGPDVFKTAGTFSMVHLIGKRTV
jgi:hypothetical protein